MPIPFLSSINLTKNEVENFKIYNLANDPGTLTSGGDFGYFWLNTTNSGGTIPTLKWWDGTNIRSIIDSTNIGSFTSGLATDLAGGGAGQIVYQDGVNDTKFLAAGTAGQVLSSNGSSAPSWLDQSSLSVGSATTATTATNVAGGANGSILVQSGVGTTGQLSIGASGYILTSNGTTPGWSASIPSTSVSGLAASATTDTTNASNISSGTLGLARLSLASGQFYVGDGSNNPAATAKSSIPLSGFGAAGADVAMGGFKITGLADPAAATDAATRGYVDSVAQGLDVKASCLVATTADITLSSPGAISIDNIPSTSFTAGTTRILVRAQNTASQNGIYIWNGSGSAMTRSADADTWDELVSAFTFIEQGDTLKDTGWVCTIDAGTLGTTAVTWSQFSGAGSYTANRGLVLSGTAFNFAQNSDYAVGDLPYATGQTTIGLLPAVATGNALISGGVATAPSWGKIGLTTHVSGTLPIANGGTGATTFTQGQVLFAGASTISSSANLFWDNSNNRLGIGTATPSDNIHVVSSGNCVVKVKGGTGNNGGGAFYVEKANGVNDTLTAYGDTSSITGGTPDQTTSIWTASGIPLLFQIGNGERLRIASDGVCTWSNVGGVAGTAMTLNGNGLGVGVSPATKLDVWSSGSNTRFSSLDSNGCYVTFAANGTAKAYIGSAYHLSVPAGSVNDLGIRSEGQIVFSTGGGSTKAIIDSSGNVGIGTTTPGKRLTVADASPTIRLNDTNTSVAGGVFGTIDWLSQDSSMPGGLAAKIDVYDDLGGYGDRGAIRFFTNNGTSLGERMVLTSAGNLGLGVTPSAWGGGYKALQLGEGGTSIFGGQNFSEYIQNGYWNGSAYKYVNSFAASKYYQANGVHSWYTAASGTAGASFTWTSALMTLDASGRLLLGTATTSNWSVTIADGSSSASIALASDNGIIVIGRAGTPVGSGGFGNNSCIARSGGTDFAITGSVAGDLCIAPEGTKNILFGTSGSAGSTTRRLSIKSTGQLNFVGQASDPAGAAGDLYYNSGSNLFRVYDTGWKTLSRKYVVQLSDASVTVLGNAYTITHNLGSQDVTVSIRRTTDNAVVQADVVMPAGGNTVTVTFAAAITAAQFYVTVIG